MLVLFGLCLQYDARWSGLVGATWHRSSYWKCHVVCLGAIFVIQLEVHVVCLGAISIILLEAHVVCLGAI